MKIFLLAVFLLPLAIQGQTADPLVLKLQDGVTLHFDNLQKRRQYEAAHPTATPAPSVAPGDLKTLNGHVYRNAKVFRVEPDGITYMYAGGMSKIPFTDLPEATRQQYNYDPKKAAAFEAADASAQNAAAQNVREQNAEFARQQKAAAIQAAVDISNMPKPPVVGGQTALSTGGLNDAVTVHDGIIGKVIQVVEDGILVSNKKTVVLLEGFPKQDTIVDDARCHVMGELVGSFEYDTVAGGSSRVKRYKYISGEITNP